MIEDLQRNSLTADTDLITEKREALPGPWSCFRCKLERGTCAVTKMFVY